MKYLFLLHFQRYGSGKEMTISVMFPAGGEEVTEIEWKWKNLFFATKLRWAHQLCRDILIGAWRPGSLVSGHRQLAGAALGQRVRGMLPVHRVPLQW